MNLAVFKNTKGLQCQSGEGRWKALALSFAWLMSWGCSGSPQAEQVPAATPPGLASSTSIPTEKPAFEASDKEAEPVQLAQPTNQVDTGATPKTGIATIQFDPERIKFSMVAIGTASEGWLAYGVVFDRSSTGYDVITADHVLKDRKSLMVQAWHGEGLTAKLQPYMSVTVMHRAPDTDLAWLRVRTSACDVVPLSISQPNQTTSQPAWTYQVNAEKAVFEPHEIEKQVSAKRGDQTSPVMYLRLKNRIEPGLSGGGLLDANGKWIGIASGNNQNQAYYVAPEEIIAFMKAAGLR